MARSPQFLPPESAGGLRSERGLTLTELTVVGMLATIVMLGLTGFYFNSQRLWLDSSTKAMAQRDATLLLEAITHETHEAGIAVVTTADSLHNDLALFDSGSTLLGQFRWDASDSLIHRWSPSEDLGPVADSRVLRFQLTTVDSSLVELRLLELLSADGDTIRLASKLALLGRGS